MCNCCFIDLNNQLISNIVDSRNCDLSYQYQKSGKPRKKNRWQISSALVAKIDFMFLTTDLQVATNLRNRLDFLSFGVNSS